MFIQISIPNRNLHQICIFILTDILKLKLLNIMRILKLALNRLCFEL